jgi:hypothetical protein
MEEMLMEWGEELGDVGVIFMEDFWKWVLWGARKGKGKGKTDTGVLHCVQDDGEKRQATAAATATANTGVLRAALRMTSKNGRVRGFRGGIGEGGRALRDTPPCRFASRMGHPVSRVGHPVLWR